MSGEQLNISKWRDFEPDGEDIRAEIYKNGGFFNGILSTLSRNAYISRRPEVRSHSNRKLYNVLKHYSLALVS